MSENMEKAPGVRIPGNRQGGTTVPGSPRSGPSAESGEGPNPVEGLPTGSRPVAATAVENENEDQLVRSIVDRYLGSGVSEAPRLASIDSEDYMSVAGLSSVTPRGKRVRERESVSDSDNDDFRVKGRKVLRSRVIGSDTDSGKLDDAVTLSDSPREVASKARGRKARKQRVDKLDKLDKLDDSYESTKVVFTDCPPRLASDELKSKNVDEIVGISERWLDDMETARFRSKKINGKFSGVLKDRIVCLRSIIKNLAERVKDTGDVSYLRRRNDDLASQLRESKKLETKLQTSLKEAENKIGKMSLEISELRKKITKGLLNEGSVEAEKLPPPSVRERPDNYKIKTIVRKDTPKKKSQVRAVSVTESLHECDEQLTAISKCDEKIAKFEELLKQMRSDLYGSLETISEKVNHTVNSVDSVPKRGVPRITSNIQLVPPRASLQEVLTVDENDYQSDGEGWSEVKHRGRKSAKLNNGHTDEVATANNSSIIRNPRRPLPATPVARRRAPRAAAVAIKANTDEVTYADIIKRARESVNLKDLGIINPRMRRAANGGVIIEIAGPEGALKADSLASRLREVIGSNASISRPVVKADIRISGFDESVIKDEIITVITEIGNCLASDVRVGQFRVMKNGLNMAWVQCPLSAAIKVSRRTKINVGWSVARVEMMRSRPVQCYKCWQFGHVRNTCNSTIDRTGHCFKCGNANHSSYNCVAEPHCVICADLGYETTHRLGSSTCFALIRRASVKNNRPD